MKIGCLKHRSQPPYKFMDFLRENGFDAEEIDYSDKGYLESFDLVFILQNSFNDLIENDEIYFNDWVKRGGICCFMHQDYQRWAPSFLPDELGYVQLIHRYMPTVRPTPESPIYMCYLMPWIEKKGRALFEFPEKITPDEMLNWQVPTDSFLLVKPKGVGETIHTVCTAAQSCYLASPEWDILGSFMDPAVRSGALILSGRYGRGMYFLNQLLFPEEKTPEAERCFSFWRKYIRNLMAYFERFKAGTPEPEVPDPGTLPLKKNYKLAAHMHSLDWFGCDADPGTINALMRYMKYDICSLAIKDISPFQGISITEKYSDDHVLFIDGQEYHPFNWHDRYEQIRDNYHMLAIGIDPGAYTRKFTHGLYSDAEVDAHVKSGIRYIHEHHGAVSTAHPGFGYWKAYDYDAVDREFMAPLSGSDIEEFFLSGGRIGIMSSVDLFGFHRMLDNPAVNFIYLGGEAPCRDSVVRAIREHHTIAATWFDEADVTLNGHIPGDEVPLDEARSGTVSVMGRIAKGKIREIRIYSGAEVIESAAVNAVEIRMDFPLRGKNLDQFIRVEVEGEKSNRIMLSTPFFLV